MVSLGRALMTSPNLLLVDEPTIGLAPKSVRKSRCPCKGCAMIWTTVVITEQNANFAMTLAERIYVLEAGKIQVEGTVEDLRKDNRLLRSILGPDF